MKEFIRRNIILIVFTIAGATGGFLYWKFIGCLSGTCIIKSVWYLSTVYGALFGYVTGGLTGEIVNKLKNKKA
jgi:hypothetical protein